MTRHPLTRPLFLLGIRAAFVAMACSVAARVPAADADAIPQTRAVNPPDRAGQVTRPAPIQAAINLLRWSRDRVPIIEVVEVRPAHVHVLAEAWVVFDAGGNAQPTIYVAGWSELYRAALANRFLLQRTIRLAGVLAHERSHIDHGANEELAYSTQLSTLERLQAPEIDCNNVRRALRAVTRAQGGRH